MNGLTFLKQLILRGNQLANCTKKLLDLWGGLVLNRSLIMYMGFFFAQRSCFICQPDGCIRWIFIELYRLYTTQLAVVILQLVTSATCFGLVWPSSGLQRLVSIKVHNVAVPMGSQCKPWDPIGTCLAIIRLTKVSINQGT